MDFSLFSCSYITCIYITFLALHVAVVVGKGSFVSLWNIYIYFSINLTHLYKYNIYSSCSSFSYTIRFFMYWGACYVTSRSIPASRNINSETSYPCLKQNTFTCALFLVIWYVYIGNPINQPPTYPITSIFHINDCTSSPCLTHVSFPFSLSYSILVCTFVCCKGNRVYGQNYCRIVAAPFFTPSFPCFHSPDAHAYVPIRTYMKSCT